MSDANEPVNEYAATFRMVDLDGDGFISVDELKSLMRALGQEIDHVRAVEVMVEADGSRDGKMSLEEFTAFMSRYAGR
ncbi:MULTISPECIES: EF-hand domain-containing protein [Thermomonospora]|uniref:Ca2+-binding EF-hand superfamily protein n=1 Tax=Thermomonospora cellulosilytica TaxID=1411118 RepID=A0A7W3N220_9ACTN|nr:MULTISPECIES: EF-hand domain-containing protein [Thermomonospora]MBA9006099.1 Ca2+-binding EF-hand superfamily protein [Thermomonospora cellulosilytica]